MRLKVDRSASYAARYIAKNIVAAGLAKKAEVPVGLCHWWLSTCICSYRTFGTGTVAEKASLKKHVKFLTFVQQESSKCPISNVQSTVKQRMDMGRTDIDLPWERLDKVDALKKQ